MKPKITNLCSTLFLLLLLTSFFSSCRTVYVDNPVVMREVQHDTIAVNRETRDSIYIKDSVYIHALGDTIYRDRWHTRYVERIQWRDSIVIQRDTIPIEVRTTFTEQVKYTPTVIKLLAAIGLLAIGILIAYCCYRYKNW